MSAFAPPLVLLLAPELPLLLVMTLMSGPLRWAVFLQFELIGSLER